MIKEKIDTHSHIYPNYGGPSCEFSVYKEMARKLGIKGVFFAPSPSPEKTTSEGKLYPAKWKFDESGNMSYTKRLILPDGQRIESKASKNPYHEANLNLLETIRQENRSNSDIYLFATPLIHPVLDTEDEIEMLLRQPETVALKLHGISTFCGPEEIGQQFVDLLKRFDKPLMVHTDYYNKTPEKPAHFAYLKNDPLKWVNFAVTQDIKLDALHGACLCRQSFEMARNNPNIIFGISPDLLMTSEPERLKESTSNYLTSLFEMANPKQLTFDIDYAWNVANRNDWETQDWNSINRICSSAEQSGYTHNDIEDIFYNNAIRFFNINIPR